MTTMSFYSFLVRTFFVCTTEHKLEQTAFSIETLIDILSDIKRNKTNIALEQQQVKQIMLATLHFENSRIRRNVSGNMLVIVSWYVFLFVLQNTNSNKLHHSYSFSIETLIDILSDNRESTLLLGYAIDQCTDTNARTTGVEGS